jgi:hypothetical protein
MDIASRYSDNPEVVIDESKIPAAFRHLLPLAREWCIGDDLELEAYIASASTEQRRRFVDAFAPHFDALTAWHDELSHLVPQPDELVLFDIATNAAATVESGL